MAVRAMQDEAATTTAMTGAKVEKRVMFCLVAAVLVAGTRKRRGQAPSWRLLLRAERARGIAVLDGVVVDFPGICT